MIHSDAGNVPAVQRCDNCRWHPNFLAGLSRRGGLMQRRSANETRTPSSRGAQAKKPATGRRAAAGPIRDTRGRGGFGSLAGYFEDDTKGKTK
jgi:hypothetical protein